MHVRPQMSDLQQIAFEAYGVRVALGVANPALLDRVTGVFPPGWRPHDPADVDHHFALVAHDAGVYRVWYDGGSVAGSADLDVALDVLETKLRAQIAVSAPGLIFVHAGAVAHDGRAIVLPGMTFTGKTTLVAELVRAGATYYSDEYAVLDAEGLVHPYPKPLSMRSGGRDQTNHHVEAFGGTAGEHPVQVGMVVVAQYHPDGEWRPRTLSAGEGMLALMANTVTAQDRPQEAMAAIRNAVDGAVVLEGTRGDAAAFAAHLLSVVPV